MKRLLVFATIFLVACGSGDKKAELNKLRAEYASLGEQIKLLEDELGENEVSKSEIKTVEVAVVEPQDFVRRVMIQGRVDGDEIISLNARASGEVVMLRAEVGQQVKAGQVLAKIDDAILRKGLEEVETSYQLANTVYERQAALWKDSIGSEIQYIQAKNNKIALEKKMASLKEQMDLYLIKAPINGTLEAVNMKLGQLISPQVPAAVMINLNKLKVVAEASESYSGTVNKGDKIFVSFPDVSKDYELTISSASNFINPVNRTFAIEAKLPSGIKEIKANMLAKVSIENYRAANTISVPVNVIFKNNQGEYLYIVAEKSGKNIAEQRYVKTGVISDSRIEILEGLTPGDRIVTFGYQNLEDNTEVNVVK